MSLAVAQQMVQAMNNALTIMHVPGTMYPMRLAPQQFYYAIVEGKQARPFSEQELSLLIADKKVVKETYIWRPESATWERTKNLPDILRLVTLAPLPFQQNL